MYKETKVDEQIELHLKVGAWTKFYFFFSGSSDPVVLATTSAQESKRQNYIHELINTEETYMEDMSIVVEVIRVTCPSCHTTQSGIESKFTF